MATVLPSKKSRGEQTKEAIGQGVANLISSGSQSYMNRSDENAVRKAIMDLGDNPSARDIVNALTNVNTYGKEAKQEALKNYIGVANFEELQRKAKSQEEIAQAKNTIAAIKEARTINKESQERQNTKSIVNQLNVPEEQKEKLGESLSQSAAESLLKEQLKPTTEPFDKTLQQKHAEEFINLSKEIPKLQTNLENIDYARQLSNEVGILGTLKGAFGLSAKAKQLEGVAFTLMEPIIKIFNPSGPIAQKKLEMIQNKYAIKPTDAPWIRKGKLDALERFGKQALKRADEKMELIKKYNGNPPADVINRFDKESDTMSDVMVDYDLTGEEAKVPELPPPKGFKGRTVTSPDGQKYTSDGMRWVKK